MSMEYKKSYRGLVFWMIGYIVVMFAPMFLPKMDGGLLTRLTLILGMAGIPALMWIIWRWEKVYWINGVTFEQARDAGSERRRAFAMAHLKPFGLAALGYIVFSVIMQLCGVHFWIDIVVFCVALIGAAISTMKVKL